MKQNKKTPLRFSKFSKKKNWLVFSGNLNCVLKIAYSLEKLLGSFDFDYISDLGLIKVGKRKEAKKAVLYFQTKPIVGLLALNAGKKKEKTLTVLLDILDILHRIAVTSRAGETIAPTLFEALRKLVKKDDLKNVQILRDFSRKLKRYSADELWNLAIFAGFPDDMLDFAKFMDIEDKKKIKNLKKEIRSWYKKTDAGKERARAEKYQRDNWLECECL